jgi:hypothetical protein
MSESRDENTGQFTSAEPLYGLAGVEQEAGYVHLPEEQKEGSEELTVSEAAERYNNNSRTPEAQIKTYGAIDHLPDNVALTAEQAHKLVTERKAAEAAQAEEAEADKLRKEVDELRGVKAEEKAEKADNTADQGATADHSAVDDEVQKAISHPKVKAALEAHVSRVEGVRQQYSQAVETANDFARMSFAENFPEIANLPAQQWEGALVAMAQQEPERFASAINSLNRVAQLQTARQQQQAQQQQREQAEFHHYAKTEDARFAELVKDEAPAQMRQIEAEIPKMLSDLGVDPLEFLKLGNESKFLRSAAAQKVLVDAAKYRMMQKATKDYMSTRAPPPVPRVQRPGTATGRSNHAEASLAELSNRLSRSGSVEDAFAFYKARTKARG